MTLAQLRRRTEQWQKKLSLCHWKIEVAIVDEPRGDSESALASVTVADAYDTAEIDFRSDALDRDPSEVDISIVHELLHIHFRDINEVMWDARRGMSRDLSDAYYHRYDHELEGVVDRLARAFVANA